MTEIMKFRTNLKMYVKVTKYSQKAILNKKLIYEVNEHLNLSN